ncbi:hypothetical protein GQ457_09G015600 [Hibiscus cannabinus]
MEEQSPGSLQSWTELCRSFLAKLSYTNMTDHLRNQITPFRQEDNEAMHEAWERYRDLFRRCPMHGLPEWTQVSIFYNFVNTLTRMMLDASTNGTLLDKPSRESLEILDKLAQNDYQHPTSRRGTTRRGPTQLDSSMTIHSQRASLINMVKNMQKQSHIQEVKALDAFCELCGNNHDASKCGQNVESSCYVGNYKKNTMSNTYNPAWRNHPNFSWKNQNNILNPRPPIQTGFQNQPRQNSQQILPRQDYQQPNDYNNLENTLTQFMAQTSVYMTRTDRGTVASPSAVTDKHAETDEPAETSEDYYDPHSTSKGESSAESSHTKLDKSEDIRPPPPFPQRLKKQKQDYQFNKFFDILKQVHINLPLVEALQQMPNYAKFLKDMAAQEEKLIETLRQHKEALGWTIADIKGISPTICMHKILLEENHKPTVEAQRILNQAMKDVVRKEILKWLDAGYNQISIAPEDQSKTTFTCPYGTFVFRRMPFGMCNAPATFQRCMTAIFFDLNEDCLEIFMDDFSTFGKDLTNALTT